MKYAYLIFIVSLILGCTDHQPTDQPLTLKIPSNFPPLQYTFKNNPLTEKGYQLGKKLFNEPRFSSDNVVSCGFCHQQQYAFTHHGHDLSHGVEGRIGIRNTPSIQNVAFLKDFFYDGATYDLERVPSIPIHNPLEMNETWPSIVKKLEKDTEYIKLFAEAFEDQKISSENIIKALSQYMAYLISADSKYDQWIRKENNVTLTDEEKKGHELFKAKCASCHATDLFTDQTFKNNGLTLDTDIIIDIRDGKNILKTYKGDFGREIVTGNIEDRRKFKVPSLRNLKYTYPYMHDGRFGKLEAVLDFYDSGIEDSPTLDPILKQNNRLGIALNDEEKKLLLVFLNTLNDEKFTQEKYSR